MCSAMVVYSVSGMDRTRYIPSLESVFYTGHRPCSSAAPWPLTGSFAQRVLPAGSCLFFLLALWLSLLLPALYLLLARLPRNSEFLPLYYTLLCTWLGQPPQAKAREGGEKTLEVIWRRKRDNGGGFGEWREPRRPGAAFPWV